MQSRCPTALPVRLVLIAILVCIAPVLFSNVSSAEADRKSRKFDSAARQDSGIHSSTTGSSNDYKAERKTN
jgi:hypothetical protein